MSDQLVLSQTQTIYKYKIPPAGAIQPEGWILHQLENDLIKGYIGQYDRVSNTVDKGVFVKQDRMSKRKYGLRKEWWNGEHEGYWKDAVIRMAFLTNNKLYKEKAHEWIREIKEAAYNNDGYIGIYRDCDKPNCRFQHVRGNGELWVTSRIIMAMLAYYEYTNDQELLKVCQHAVQKVMDAYWDQNYFVEASGGGGVSHGIGFFEVLEWMYRITKEKRYLDFSLKLYHDFNNGQMRDDDLTTDNLLNKEQMLQDHGAHLAEGLFVPEFIASAHPNATYIEAANNVMYKLEKHLTPGGAMRCDEWVKERVGTADERYEYCGIAEMISPLGKMIAFSGDLSLADKIETMAYNAGQGARLPILSALSYLSADNRIKINHREIARRETYDACHFAAACCALNGARLMPYLVENMWVTNDNDNEVLALLPGPSQFNTEIDGVMVNIMEQTDYPFSNQITFQVNPTEPLKFDLSVRKPFGCDSVEIFAPDGAKITQNDSKLSVTKKWRKMDQVKITFHFPVRIIHQPPSKSVKGKGAYLKHGPLVYAMSFDHKIDTTKEYNNSGFYRYKIKVADSTQWNGIKLDTSEVFIHNRNGKKHNLTPWDKPYISLNGPVFDLQNNRINMELQPMGSTIFRRVTFPVK